MRLYAACLGALLLALAALPVGGAAPGEVATVLATEGPVTWSHAGGTWYAAFPDQRNRIEDHVRTGPESVATLEFDVGGRVGLNENTEIVITGAREVQAVDQGLLHTITVTAGGIWAKFTGQPRELQVQTSGGVMGIKGTEFVVDIEEDGSTSLSVLEGEVEVRPEDGSEAVSVKPGFQVRFARKVRPALRRVGSPEQLRQALEGRWKRYLRRFAMVMAAAGKEKWAGWARHKIPVVKDPVALSGGRPRPGGRGGRKARVDWATNLVPAGNTVAGRPSFSWDPVEGARAYVLLMSGGDDLGKLDWADLVKEPHAAYPPNGRPLDPGRYYWRVIPLGPGGKPVGKASQTWFDYQGGR